MISAIIAVRNGEHTLAQTLAAVQIAARNVQESVEVIVVNDGSTDGTRALLDSASLGDLRVLHLDKSVGRGRARNHGAAMARGDVLAIVDADDVALPARFALPLALLRDQDLVVVGGNAIFETRKGVRWRLNATYPTDSGLIAAWLDAGRNPFCHSSVLIDKAAFLAVGGYRDYTRAQDLDLFRRMSKIGAMANCNEDVVIYRHDPWVSWQIYRETRAAERAMGAAKATSNNVLLPIRYAASNLRRLVHFWLQRLGDRT